MTGRPEIERFMDASADILGISIDPAWRGGVADNLEILFRFASLVQAAASGEEREPAPVFRP